jgi:hypothetical protein
VTADLGAWLEANDTYLGAAMQWLELLLESHAGGTETLVLAADRRGTPRGAPAAGEPPPTSSWWNNLRRGNAPERAAEAVQPPPALPPSPLNGARPQLDEAVARLRAAEAFDPPPALIQLQKRMDLSTFERDVLLLCVAMELDTAIAGLCARVQEDSSRTFPTFELAMTVFDDPAWDAQSPLRPLRYYRIIEVSRGAAQPLTTSALRADERIVNFVKGLAHLDDRIAPFVTPMNGPAPASALPESQLAVARQILDALERDQPQSAGLERNDRPHQPVQLLGRDSDSKQLIARTVAEARGRSLYRMPADMLPTQAADLETLIRLWELETLLLPLALYLEAQDVDRSNENHAVPLKRFLARSSGTLFVDARETWPVPRGSHSFDVGKPEPVEQRALWLAALGAERTDEAQRMAGQFNLSAAAIARIATEARTADEAIPLGERLWRRASQETQLRVDAFAQRIETKATWNDIVLPPAEVALLRQIAVHVGGRSTVYDDWGFRERMNRGFGISALFAGESGTGKTMAAEVIANELGMSLHRIDLSAVVSKWVGESEKTLQSLFNAADDANGILFFDEADALFGKRSEVQQSQDRFANIEINFLLQRLETYRGVSILATNMRSALDPAFLRRLRFIVSFPFPGPEERRAIWEKVFPGKTPKKKTLDYARLAKLSLTGGSIHNTALAAAFLAAQRKTEVSMPIVLEAARTELRKIEKPVNEADFQWTEPVPLPEAVPA